MGFLKVNKSLGRLFLLCSLSFCARSTIFAQVTFKEYKTQELNILLESYQSISADYLRGLSQEEWDKRVAVLKAKVDSAKTKHEFYFALRYFAPLINDGHFIFPDFGGFNRNAYFTKQDTLLPLWVKSTMDNRVFVVHDYSGIIPAKAELLEINGYNIAELSEAQHYLLPMEDHYAYDYMNKIGEENIKRWGVFSNYLYCEKIKSPFVITYMAEGNMHTKTLEGMQRQVIDKLYKKRKDSIKSQKEKREKVTYKQYNDSIGILDINLFWGGNLAAAIFFPKNDSKFEKLMEKCMKQIQQDGIKQLIIDIRDNGGGYMKNVYQTMSYFIDTSFQDKTIYKVSQASKEASAPALIANDIEMFYGKRGKEKREATVEIYKSMTDGTLMSIDTLMPMYYQTTKNDYFFAGKIYVLTNASTYSASIEFCNLIRSVGRGIIVGQSPGGYARITGGPSTGVSSNTASRFRMRVPYTVIGSAAEYAYIEPDWPIAMELAEWLDNKDSSLEKVIRRIQGSVDN